jgi:D-arabinose 1-dehydrogenase-like Zn-dependent alcohol dehydrogenase
VAVKHDLDPFLNLLQLDGTMTLVGIPAESHPSPSVAGLIVYAGALRLTCRRHCRDTGTSGLLR